MQLNQFSLKARLAVGFSLVLLLTVLIAGVAWNRLATTRVAAEAAAEASARALDAERWQGLTRLNAARTLAIAKSGGSDRVKAHFDPLIKSTSAEISALQKVFEAAILDETDRALFDDIAAKRKAYVSSRDAIFGLLEIEDPGAEEALNSQLLPAAEQYLAAIDTLGKYEREQAATLVAQADAASTQAQWVLLVLAVVCVVLGAGTAWVIARSVLRPLEQVVVVARRIAEGDLTASIPVAGRDELSHTLRALADMQSSLQRVVGDVRAATESISVASGEVAAGSHDLSGRTEQAAANLQQTASSMEHISTSVRHSSDSARTANQLASGAASAASEGGEVVSRVVHTMESIAESSRRIADIISVIDGIAFQTNILALNAAVEAARAGEQGRGFAVVAGEVRALAHRVTEAAKEVKSLIGASVEQVGAGSTLVQEAGASMSHIVDAVQRVSDVIGEISAAASEQADGVMQVNTAVTQLDQMTQQNAALVEESAAAAESLKDQAARLAHVVAVFRLPA
jgi:methyl-accepting chemotaxis protein